MIGLALLTPLTLVWMARRFYRHGHFGSLGETSHPTEVRAILDTGREIVARRLDIDHRSGGILFLILGVVLGLA